MVKQIMIDENNVVQLCSIGGIIEGGINVPDIPDGVRACPAKWKFENGKFVPNEAYTEPAETEELTVSDLAETAASDKLEVEMAIAELAEVIMNG